MNGAQEGLGDLDARQTKKTFEGRRGGKAGEKTFKAKEIAQFREEKQTRENSNRSKMVEPTRLMNEQ